VKTAETDIVPYQETDKVQCPDCDEVLSYNRLRAKKGHKFPNGTGKQWQSWYEYCSCGSEKALIYNPGDGSPKRLVRGTLVKS